MTRRWTVRVILPAVLLAFAVATGDAQQKGRYKKNGDNCEWDGNDSGPNQCTPTTKGRFKKDGDSCRWDANDNGPDQCRPTRGLHQSRPCLDDARPRHPETARLDRRRPAGGSRRCSSRCSGSPTSVPASGR
jgi:hypothetical protein